MQMARDITPAGLADLPGKTMVSLVGRNIVLRDCSNSLVAHDEMALSKADIGSSARMLDVSLL